MTYAKFAFFNVAVLTQPSITASALRACGHAARAWAAETPVPWFFVVTHDRIDPGDRILVFCTRAAAGRVQAYFSGTGS